MTAKVFIWINIAACSLAGVMLLFLFLYPHHNAIVFRDDMVLHCNKLNEAVSSKEWESARGLIEDAQARFDTELPRLRLFFDHEDVDDLGLALHCAVAYLKEQDSSQASGAIEEVRMIVTYLAGIETFTLTNLF